jgi:hypothetical protein
MPIFQVFLGLDGVCLRANSQQGIGFGHNAKAVVRLKGYVSGHVHGRIVAFSDLIVEPHAIF